MDFSTFFQKDGIASSTSRGIIAGVIGGLAGTAVKTLVENFLPVRKIDQRSAQIKIVDDLSYKITGTPVSIQNEAIAEQLVNIPFGASVGAAYGYKKRDSTAMKVMDGVAFGATTWITTHETTFPVLGLEPKPTDIPIRMQANELLAHVLFGVTTEVVRSIVNDRLKQRRLY